MNNDVVHRITDGYDIIDVTWFHRETSFICRFSVGPACLRSEKSPEVASGKLEASKVLGQERRVGSRVPEFDGWVTGRHTHFGASDFKWGDR